MKKHGMVWILVVLMGTLFLSVGVVGCNKPQEETPDTTGAVEEQTDKEQPAAKETDTEHPAEEDPAEAPPKDHPAH